MNSEAQRFCDLALRADGPAGEVQQALEVKAAEWLDTYSDQISRSLISADEKVLNDSVWGSIRLHSWEVAIIDSPLMQRLRGIKQLGVVHWVYPNATHTRFEHSIGVMHATQSLVEGIERNSGRSGHPVVDARTLYLLRLAGLVHDCGHAAMSHVTGPVVEELPGVEELQTWLHALYALRKPPSASEAFAAIFVRSPAFRRLLSLPAVGADFVRDVDEDCAIIAGLLLGAPVFPKQAFLSLVISGPFDADKLDYMQRDSKMAGVPCLLDVSRLLEKVHVVNVPPNTCHDLDDYRTWAQVGESDSTLVLAIPRSSTSVLDELAVGRSTLYDKVYYHQKVRALETQVRHVVRSLRLDLKAWLEFSDDRLLTKKSKLARAVLDRRLLKRAFYFTPPNDDEHGDEAEAGWRRLRREHRSREFDRLLLKESKRVAKLLDITWSDSGFSPSLDLPTVKDLDQFAFLADSYQDIRTTNAGEAGQRTEAGKQVAKYRCYVYGPEDTLPAIYFAAQHLLSSRYGMATVQDSYAKTKLEPSELLRHLQTLKDKRYFGNHVPAELEGMLRETGYSLRTRKLERFLRVAWPRIVKVAEKTSRYQARDGTPISSSSVAAFLRQFETIELARTALRMLEALDFKDRSFLAAKLEEALRSALQNGDIDYVVPLGSTGDSSAMLSYLMGDIDQQYRRDVLQLELALERIRDGNGRILLWDDFCGNGGHTITTLAQWLGRPAIPELQAMLLDEKLADPLNKSRAAILKRSSIVVAFALVTPKGARKVRRAIKLLALNAKLASTYEVVSNNDELKDDKVVFRTDEEQEAFYVFIDKKTREMLQHKVDKDPRRWNKKKVGERIYGYGNWAKLLVFFYNVPTVTLTLLWQSSPEWTPLLPRRAKPSA